MSYSVEKLIQKNRDWTKDDFVFFWGHRKGKKIGKTCFSQWYEIEFEVDGHRYNCAEQYMMAQKAWLFKDRSVFAKILDSTDPKEIKALGREVENFDPKIWNQHKFEIVVKGNLGKFGCNLELKDFLYREFLPSFQYPISYRMDLLLQESYHLWITENFLTPDSLRIYQGFT